MNRVRLRLLVASTCLLTSLCFVINLASAQRTATDTYAIINARIVTLAGPVIDRGTVVIRGGLIASVGANVTAPADARIIDGKDLIVYPGIIDAATNLGLPEPPATPSPSPGGGFLAQLI